MEYGFNTACYLVYVVKRVWVRECIEVYPDRLGPRYVTWAFAMLSGYKIVGRRHGSRGATGRPPIARLYHKDADYQDCDPQAINGRCVDITKKWTDQVFQKIFGYSAIIDPAIYSGLAMRKSNYNWHKKDRMIIECPTEKGTDGDFVYQKLIRDFVSDGVTREFRMCVIGNDICEIIKRHRIVQDKFTMVKGNVSSTYGSFHSISVDENDKILRFCREFGLEIGEMDVLRDGTDGKIHIIDANKTATYSGRPAWGFWNEFWSCRRRARVFRNYLASRSLTS